MSRWKKIDSAPTDGRHVLIVAGDPPKVVYEAYYEKDCECWYQANTHHTDAHDGSLWGATHWQPLPEPPKDKR